MRYGQGLPVNMIVLTALALLVLVVVGAFFISGFGQASSSVQVINATQAECNGLCQGLATTAFNYDDCDALKKTGQGVEYRTTKNCDEIYGACRVTLRNGSACDVTD